MNKETFEARFCYFRKKRVVVTPDGYKAGCFLIELCVCMWYFLVHAIIFTFGIHYPLWKGAFNYCELVSDGEYMRNVLDHLPTWYLNIYCFTRSVHQTSEYQSEIITVIMVVSTVNELSSNIPVRAAKKARHITLFTGLVYTLQKPQSWRISVKAFMSTCLIKGICLIKWMAKYFTLTIILQ